MQAATIRLNTADTDRAIRQLRAKAPAAIARALNRAAASGTTAMIRVISQDTGITQADLKGSTKRNRRIWTQEAQPGHETVRVFASLDRIPLMDFGAKGPEPSRGKGRGVTAGLKGGARRYERAFIATMQSGHRGVFRRKERGQFVKVLGRLARRLPIKELFGPSIAHVWTKHAAVGQQRAQEQLVKNLQSEFRFATRGSP